MMATPFSVSLRMCLHLLDDPEQHLHLPLGEGGGGLVHNDQPGVFGHRLGNLHQLAVGGGQVADQGSRLQPLHLELVQDFLGLLVHQRLVLEQTGRQPLA